MQFPEEADYILGHEVSADGMKPGNLNLKGIVEMAPPANYTEVWRFLGMTGFSGGSSRITPILLSP